MGQLKHIVFVSDLPLEGILETYNTYDETITRPIRIGLQPVVNAAAWQKIGIQVHANQHISRLVRGYNSIVDFDGTKSARADIAAWKPVARLMDADYESCVAAWDTIEPEFVAAYLNGEI